MIARVAEAAGSAVRGYKRAVRVGLSLSAAVLALVVSGCATTPPAPDAKEVDDLDLEGTKALKESDIKSRILTGESPWWPGWLPIIGRTEWFDPSAWQADLRRIQRYYEANGYYQARVLQDQVTETKPGHVKLLVKVSEGMPARVVSLDVKGLDELDGEMRARASDNLPLRVGDVFLEEKWQETKATLASRLRELGFAEVVVTGEALVDADAARVETSLEVATGFRYKFGKIFVATDPGAQVPPRLIADVALPEVKPGDWFSESALAEAQARVFQMGVFSGVKVNRGAPDREDKTVPVVIDVREAPFTNVRIGGGLGFDLIRNEVRGTAEYTNRNLGLARLFSKGAKLDRLTLKGKVGWAFIPTVFDLGRPGAKNGLIGRVLTEYEVPRVFDVRTLSFQGSLDLSRALDSAFDYWGGETKLGFVWRPRTDVTVFPSLNLNTYFVGAQVSVRDNVPSAAIGCPLAPAACVISFADVTVEWDRRDNRLEPHDGFLLSLATSAGVSQTTGLRPYVRVVPEARGYVSWGEDKSWTLAGKVRAGTIFATDNDTPIVARFFSGGSNMRGFNTRRLSPLVAVPTNETVTVDGQQQTLSETLPIGGNGLLEAAIELRWNVWKNLVLAVFNDWGLVTSNPLGPGTRFASALYAAVGFGVRYRTPLGPIRFDFGVRLPFIGGVQEVTSSEPRYYRSSPGCFIVSGVRNLVSGGGAAPDPGTSALPYAGSPDNSCAIHFSIGEAF